ncbi:unnamed protein product [Staurois parvus]|uniref:EML-like first beta-propeller domain-containing protein n=1 Tax=Staurois parvus TaxID=386267 RepID=A0ABN9AGK5_9NEOB|nr:unnamed protein product [Staurois parvus]
MPGTGCCWLVVGEGTVKSKQVVFFPEEGVVKLYLRGRSVPLYVPDSLVASYNIEAKGEPPTRELQLEWVYGYRGRDCRSNLFILPSGELLYFTAAVCVLYDPVAGTQRHYRGHTDDIKSLAVHPDSVTIASGQVAGNSQDGKSLAPHVRIWHSVSLCTLHVIGVGHFDRAVTCLSFSKTDGGSHLCACDESGDHVLSVWQWQREQKVTEVKCSTEPVLAAIFHPTEPNLIITCGKSQLYYWSLEGATGAGATGGTALLSKRQGVFEKYEKPRFVLCVAFAENGDVVTGDSNGKLCTCGGKAVTGSLMPCAAPMMAGFLLSVYAGMALYFLEVAKMAESFYGIANTRKCRRPGFQSVSGR